VANTTWNPSDKSASITLSGTNNLTATSTSSVLNGVRAIDKQITGKFYWEVTATTFGVNGGIGVASPNWTLANGLFGTAGPGTSCVANNGNIYVDGSTTGTSLGTIASGTVVCIAVDVGARLIWYRSGAAGNWNNSASASPATGAGGIAVNSLGDGIAAYPALTIGTLSNAVTANFGDSAFTGTVPSGFTAGFTAGVTSPTNAIATQLAVEHWLAASTPAQVTQVALEHWASVAAAVPSTGSPIGVVIMA
jgi:hypothetical protein